MKTITIKAFFLFAACLMALAPLHAQENVPEYLPGELYFKVTNDYDIELSPNSDAVEIEEQIPFFASFVEVYGVTSVKRSFFFANTEKLTRVFRVRFTEVDQTEGFISELSSFAEVEYAEPIPTNVTTFTPNDLGANTTSGQWGLHKVDAQNAWNLADGNGITIAIVDNAFILTHPDLVNKYVPGFDAADVDSDPSAPNTSFQHGTHVAGIAGAETDNGIGVASIGYKASIMPIKTTATGYPHYYITHGYEGITAAANMGADIINCSWGGSGSSTTNANVIANAYSLGTVIVAAAGNSGNTAVYYPASYPNVVSVASTNINDVVSTFSTYGTNIDVCAPGESILSCVPGGYGIKSGTSMASPMVAGLCALVWSTNTSYTNNDVVNCVLSSADNIDAQNPSKVGLIGSGRINALAAVQCASVCPPMYVLVSPTDDITTATPQDFEADMFIEASNDLAPGTTVDYDAGDDILLVDGFWAQEGTQFHAFIDGCGGLKVVDTDENSDLRFSPTQLSAPPAGTPNAIEADGLLDAAPNPFTATTAISYTLPKTSEVSLAIYDNTGRQVMTLIDQSMQDAGYHQYDLSGDTLPSGIYYCRLIADGQVHSLKIIRTGL